MFFTKRKKEPMDYRLVFNSRRLMVFKKNKKTLCFLKKNKHLLSENKEINQETNIFFTIPFRFNKLIFNPIVNGQELVYGIDYIEYSINNKIKPSIKNKEKIKANSVFNDITFTSIIDEKLAPSIYKAFNDLNPTVKAQRLFDSIILKLNDEDIDGMSKGRSVLYLNKVLELCKNDNSLNYKKSLLEFEDLNNLISYKKETNSEDNKALIDSYFESLPSNSLYEKNIPCPDSLNQHGFINLLFIYFIKDFEEFEKLYQYS